MIRSASVLLLVGAALLVTSFLSASRSSIAALGPITVEITDSGYSPATLTIPPSTTVTWINKGSVPHTVTSDSGHIVDSPVLEPRFSYSYTFHNEGTFPYHDDLLPGSTGAIIVTDGAEVAPPVTPAPTATATAIPTANPPVGPADPAVDENPSTTLGSGTADVSASGPDGLESADASATTVTVDMGNEWFGEVGYQNGVYAMTIQTGDTVQWNVAEGFHNVYECGGNWAKAPGCYSPAWNSELLAQGDSYSRTFNVAGTFDYLCTIHPQTMRGKVIVEAEDPVSEDPTPTPAPIAAHTDDSADDSADDATATPDTTPAAARGSSTAPDPVVAGEAALPVGGGAPPFDGGVPTTPFFVAAAIAFAASALIFWRWKHVSQER